MSQQSGISEFFDKLFLIGLGAKKVSEEKIKELIDELVKKGEISKEESEGYFNKFCIKIKSERKEFEDRVSELIQDLLEKMDIPTKNDIETLKSRVAELESKLAEKDKQAEV